MINKTCFTKVELKSIDGTSEIVRVNYALNWTEVKMLTFLSPINSGHLTQIESLIQSERIEVCIGGDEKSTAQIGKFVDTLVSRVYCYF